MKLKNTFRAPLLVLSVVLILTASRFLDLEKLAYRDNICLAVIVLELLILVVPFAFYVKLAGSGFGKKLRMAPIRLEGFLITLLAALTLIFGDILIKLLLYQLGFVETEYSVYQYYLTTTDTDFLYSLLTFAVVPAIAEELVFRSVLCAEYEANSPVAAVIASALCYGMYGLHFGYFPIFFFMGLICGLTLYITRSTFAAMLVHLIYNLFHFFLAETVWNIIEKPQSTFFLIFAVAGLFLACLLGLFGECEHIYYGFSASNRDSSYADACPHFSGKKFLEILLAPPFLATVLVFILATVQFPA